MKPNLPNSITTLRVVITPLIVLLLFQNSMTSRLLAFAFFLIAALSDLWDGYLARSRNQITDFGKLVDPVADKLLLVATLIPLYLLTLHSPYLGGLPVYGGIPLWVVAVLLGRELAITVLRTYAARRGHVVAAGSSGKRKALMQNIFIGSMILWVAFNTGARQRGWTGPLWQFWEQLNGWFSAVALTLALALTVYSMAVYVLSFRRILADKPA
jgi:CDP-diacylglycerol--glycerol-3-phosphate 3-phosphatidyltransferase